MGARYYTRRELMMAGISKPYDAKVEYLESTGTQRIDIGYTFKPNIQVVFDVIYTNSESTSNYSKCWGLNRSGYEVLWSGNQYFFGGSRNKNFHAPVVGTKYICDFDFTAGAMVAKVDGAIVKQTSGTQPNVNEKMYLFAMNGKGSIPVSYTHLTLPTTSRVYF